MLRIKHKKLAVAAAGVAVLAIAGAAFAYFTNSGTGSGNASVGTSSTIELSSPLVGSLYPDGADVPVTVTIHNPGAGSQYVGTVSGVDNTNDNGTPANAADVCLGSWFEVDSKNFNGTLKADDGAAGGLDQGSVTTAVRMKDNGGNQDACKTKTMSITWSSN
jgi:hypothetical protein